MSETVDLNKPITKLNYVIDSKTQTVRAELTEELKLQKPLTSDFYDIGVHNSNMQKIDEYLKNFKASNSNLAYDTTVTTSNWVLKDGFYNLDLTHHLGTKKLYIAVLDSTTFESIFIGYKPTTENTVTILSDVALNCIVMVLSAASKTIQTNVVIDDSIKSNQKTWSSVKIDTELNKKSGVGHRHNMSDIDGLSLEAKKVSIADSTNVFEATNVEDALLENRMAIKNIQNQVGAGTQELIATNNNIVKLLI